MDVDAQLLQSVIAGAVGFAGGLATPWVKWDIEKRRARRQARAQSLEELRRLIQGMDFCGVGGLAKLLGSPAYLTLRPLLAVKTREFVEAPNTVYVPAFEGSDVRKEALLAEIARIERLWGLI